MDNFPSSPDNLEGNQVQKIGKDWIANHPTEPTYKKHWYNFWCSNASENESQCYKIAKNVAATLCNFEVSDKKEAWLKIYDEIITLDTEVHYYEYPANKSARELLLKINQVFVSAWHLDAPLRDGLSPFAVIEANRIKFVEMLRNFHYNNNPTISYVTMSYS